MKKYSKQLGLVLFILAYGLASYWVFTRSTPVIYQRPVTIRFAHWQIERGPPDGIAAAIKRYEELHPRVRVVQLLIPGGTIYRQWMRANLAGDTGPDIMEWGSWLDGQKDIPARYFAPLTSELAQPNPYNRGTSQEHVLWQDTFHDKLLAPRRDSPDPGQIYAVNIAETTLRLFCNIELLRQATGSVTAPKTFDDLRQILARIQAYGRRTELPITGIAGSRDNARAIAEPLFSGTLLGVSQRIDDSGILYLHNRQVLAAYLEGKWNYSDPAVKAGLQVVREVTQSMKPGFFQLRRDDAMLEFLRGESVFFFYGTWDATSLARQATFKIVPMQLPQVMPDDPEVGRYVIGPAGEGIGETSMAMYLNKTSAHPAEALDFLQFLTSVPGNQLFTDHSGWLPSVNGVDVPVEIRGFRDYRKGYALGQAPYNVIGSEVTMQWDRHFHYLIGDQGSADKYAAALDQYMPAAIRADLQSEMRNSLLLVKPQDAMIQGWAGRAAEAPGDALPRARQHELEMGQTMSEGLALQMKRVLELTAEKK